MTFETSRFYRRKPETVRAIRLSADGNIPIYAADEPWLKQLIAERRLVRAPSSWWLLHAAGNRPVAGGEWIVRYDDSGIVIAIPDTMFRNDFDTYEPEEDE